MNETETVMSYAIFYDCNKDNEQGDWMLDEKDLQAIAALIQQSEHNIMHELKQEIADSRNEIMAYIESKVERDIKTIAEGVSTLVAQRPKQ